MKLKSTIMVGLFMKFNLTLMVHLVFEILTSHNNEPVILNVNLTITTKGYHVLKYELHVF
jgi:hypothetical protein